MYHFLTNIIPKETITLIVDSPNFFFYSTHIPKKWQDDSPKLADPLAPHPFCLQIGGLQRQHFMLPVQQAQGFSELLAANVQVQDQIRSVSSSWQSSLVG
jgi:hypothetical protein